MGEAKNRLAEMRTRMMVELERWMAPSWPEEAQLNSEILALAFQSVPRFPDSALDYMRMEPQQCHQNASAYVRLDPTGTSRHIAGWWKRDGICYFHSVVSGPQGLCCVTPHSDRSPLQFAPDPEISWVNVGGVITARRRGQRVPQLVRARPRAVIAEAAAAHAALISGAHPRTITLPL